MKKRIISFILVLATLIGVLGTASITSVAAPTNYQQGDPRWGGIYYGKWNLAASGCGILSTVNAVNYLTGNYIPPTELAAWAHANNHYNGTYGQGSMRSTLYANVTAAFGAKYGFKVTNLTWGRVTHSTLINHLANGGTAVVHVPNHFMALCGYNRATGQYLVYDSAANPAKRNTSVYGSWLTAAQLNSNAGTTIDWFCLVHRNGTGTVAKPAATTTAASSKLYTVKATVASGSGKVHFGNNVTSASVGAGTTVNYQVTPAAGYKVSKITIYGTSQTIKNNGGDAVYQFRMEAANATVSVTFAKIATTAAKAYTVTAKVASGSGKVHFGNNVTSAKVANGTKVYFQTTPSAGYKVSKITVGGKAVTVKNGGADCVYTFNMPTANTTVSVTFAKITTTKTYTVTAKVASGSGKVHFGNNVTSAKVGNGTVVNFQTTPAAGYKVSKITVGGKAVTVKNGGADCVYQFTMPTANTTVSVTFTKIATAATTYKVRCGTFSVKANAQNYANQIKAKGFDAYVGTVSGQYVVYAGTFSVKTNAQNYVNKLKAKGISAYVSTT